MVILRNTLVNSHARLFSNDDSSDDEKKTKKSKKPAEKTQKAPTEAAAEGGTAAERLNKLLASMQTDDNSFSFTKNAIDMAKPGEGNKKRKDVAKQKAASKDVFNAAKQVAALMNDETGKKQTESELLNKLLGHADARPNQGGEASEQSLA